MRLPEVLLWKIWTYVGPSAYFLDKALIPIIQEKRELFIRNPLWIHYKLCRYVTQKSLDNDYNVSGVSERQYMEDEKSIRASGRVGFSQNNVFQISRQMSDKIIPLSSRTETTGGFIITHWVIHSIYTIDERSALYTILNFVGTA